MFQLSVCFNIVSTIVNSLCYRCWQNMLFLCHGCEWHIVLLTVCLVCVCVCVCVCGVAGSVWGRVSGRHWLLQCGHGHVSAQQWRLLLALAVPQCDQHCSRPWSQLHTRSSQKMWWIRYWTPHFHGEYLWNLAGSQIQPRVRKGQVHTHSTVSSNQYKLVMLISVTRLVGFRLGAR